MKNDFSISIIVPVLNETDSINDFVGHLKSTLNGTSCQIIVVDGDEKAGTIVAIRHPDIITLVSRRGRSRQMNAGAAVAKNDILLFLHADCQLPLNAVSKIIEAMQNETYAAGAFELNYDSDRLIHKLIAAGTNLRCRITRVPYGDQGIFIRRKYFEQIGGFREIDILEDVDLMRRIKKDRADICIIRENILASARRWDKEGIFYGLLRNIFMVAFFRFGVNPDKLAGFYRANK